MNRKMRLATIAPLCALLAGLALYPPDARSADPAFPELNGPVVDEAGLLRPETEARIATRLQRLEADTGVRLVIATLADLRGQEVDDYGLALGRHWGVGRRQGDKGALLLVAPRERRIRLEAEAGLEPRLSDALAARIIHDDMLPAFRGGAFEAGIIQGLAAIEAQLRLDPALAEQRADAVRRPAAAAPVGPAVMVFLMFLFVFLGTLRAAEGRWRDVRGRTGPARSRAVPWRGHSGAAVPGRPRSEDGDFEGGGVSVRW